MKKVGKRLKRYLIPSDLNDNRPQLLRPTTVAFVCLVAIVVQAAFLFGSSYIAPRSRLFGLIVANALVDETNQARVSNGIAPLHESPLLDAAAQEKANDMVANNYFAHTSPTGVTPWFWFENVGYNFTSAGENLAVNFADSQDVTTAWLNSPEHRANIMNAGFTDIGMATAQGTYDGSPAVYVVELFGTPAAASIPFINTAAAAAPPLATNIPVTKPITKPVTKPAPKTVTPVQQPLAVNATSNPTFVAVQGASITAGATTTATAPVTQPTAATVQVPAASNPIQTAASDPREIVDYFYLAIAILFFVALILNIFIKIRIQYPQLIFGGMLVIVLASLFIVLNQHAGLSSPVIL